MNRIARWLALGVALGGVAVASAPHPVRAEEPVLSPTAEAGRQEFNIYCVSCHGEDAKGDGVAAPALKQKPADLTGIAARRGGTFDRVVVAEIIDGRQDMPAHGSREMPIWGNQLGQDASDKSDEESLVQGRVALLVAYLEAIQVPAPAGRKVEP